MKILPRGAAPGRPHSTGREGLTLIEAVVFLTLITMAMSALSYTTVSVHQLQSANETRARATEGLISVVEDVRRSAQSLVGAEPSWSEALVAAYSPGGIPGEAFDLPGLEAPDGQPTVCTVTVITDETLTDDDIEFDLGMPMDLDNDGVAGDADVRDSAQLLPVVVRVRWQSALGERELKQGLLLLGV